MKLHENTCSVFSLTADQVRAWLENDSEVTYEFRSKDTLAIARDSGLFGRSSNFGGSSFSPTSANVVVDYILVGFGEYAPAYAEDGSDAWLGIGSQYFAPSKLEDAIACFLRRLVSDNPAFNDGTGESIGVIKIRQTGELKYGSHYAYIDAVLEKFWLQVFGKTPGEMSAAGICTAHGDKCYGYQAEWREAGIEFHHGALLYLLTYTKLLGNTPKHDSCAWVIANYHKYLPAIQEAERQVLLEKYGIVRSAQGGTNEQT